MNATIRKSMRTCLVLLITIMLFSPLSAALPSAFEEDHSGGDLDELESMLSGGHRDSSYSQGQIDLYRSSQPLQTFAGPAYDPPYKDVFKNDTYFGDFIQQLDGALMPEINETWSNLYLNGTLDLNDSEKRAEKPSSHFIKPILIEEPDF
jgi:hypothetical protein